MNVTVPPTGTLTATLTGAGQAVFPYLQPDLELVKRAEDYAYPGTPVVGADVTPLLEDQNGNAALAMASLMSSISPRAVNFSSFAGSLSISPMFMS